MSIQAGTHTLGPSNGTLTVDTKRIGAAAKAGHDLTIAVDDWNATLRIGEDARESFLTVDADADSLRVLSGTGGISSLGDKDKKTIKKTIDDDILKRQKIHFQSNSVQTFDGRVTVTGDLTLAGKTAPISFDLLVSPDGKFSANAVVKQTDWGIKPFSGLFGALKVADDVVVSIQECAVAPS